MCEGRRREGQEGRGRRGEEGQEEVQSKEFLIIYFYCMGFGMELV